MMIKIKDDLWINPNHVERVYDEFYPGPDDMNRRRSIVALTSGKEYYFYCSLEDTVAIAMGNKNYKSLKEDE